MFERFTDGARSAVASAQEEARRLGHDYLGTEHLLLGVAETPGGGGRVLRRLGFDPEVARADLIRIVGHGPALATRDDEALRALGIDIDEVRRRIEDAFGPGALDRDSVPRGRRRRRSQRCEERTPGGLRFTPRAKRSLELAAHEMRRLGSDRIDSEHILLGLIDRTDVVAVELLSAQGIATDRVRRAVLEMDRGDDGGFSMVGA